MCVCVCVCVCVYLCVCVRACLRACVSLNGNNKRYKYISISKHIGYIVIFSFLFSL